MPGSGLNISKVCDDCQSGANLTRYAGLLGRSADELARAVKRRRAHAGIAAVDERWHALLAARCDSCGTYLARRWIEEEKRSTPVPAAALAAPDDLRRFPDLDVLDPDFLATADPPLLLSGLLDAALSRSHADIGNTQLVDPDRHGLYIAAQRGFEREFLDFFEWVSDDGSACATAAHHGTKVMVPDVARSPLYTDESRDAMLGARSNAVQSIPLVSSAGHLLGVFSCHYLRPGRPSDDDAPLLDALTRAAVRALEWKARSNGSGPADPSESDRGLGDGVHSDGIVDQSRHVAAEIRQLVTEVHRLLDDPTDDIPDHAHRRS